MSQIRADSTRHESFNFTGEIMIRVRTLYVALCDVGVQKNPFCHDSSNPYTSEDELYRELGRLSWEWKQDVVHDRSPKFVCPMCRSKRLYPEGWNE